MKAAPTINITKAKNIGELPPFLGLAQRHFEKAMPACGDLRATLTIPLDMLDMLVPQALMNALEEVQVVYEKPVKTSSNPI